MRRLLALLLLLVSTSGYAAEKEIVQSIERYFRTEDVATRDEIARAITSDPAFRRDKMPRLLHRANLWEPMPQGMAAFLCDVGEGQRREVVLRIPRGYTPSRPWPLIYALHPSGQSGLAFLRYVENALGSQVDQFVVAAPTNYRQTGLDAPPPFTRDHIAILRAVKTKVHVDSDRVHAIGYSLGGYTAWTLAHLHPEEFSSIVTIASTFSTPLADDGVARELLPVVRHVRLMHVFGGRDEHPVTLLDGKSTMTMIRLNRKLVSEAKALRLGIVQIEIPEEDHYGVMPPPDLLLRQLRQKRQEPPRSYSKLFRHAHDASGWWIGDAKWEGAHWGAALPAATTAQELGSAILGLLGRVEVTVEPSKITLRTKHLAEATLRLSEGAVQWGKPVTVEVNGSPSTESFTPDTATMLRIAAETRDFDRLSWSEVRLACGEAAAQ